MAFYGAVIKPDKATAFVPPPEDWQLHLSQAALESDVKIGTRVSLYAKVQDDDPICLGTLTAGTTDFMPLDLFFAQYSEFSVVGKANVHITGYYAPMPGEDDGDDDEDGMPSGLFGEDEDEEGEDYDDEDMDEDEDEEDEEEDVPGITRTPSVVIEELPDHPVKPKANENKAVKDTTRPNGAAAHKQNQKMAEVEAEDDSEEESEEEDGDDEEEEEEQQEEQKPVVKQPQKNKDAAKPGQEQIAGAKRKGEQQPAGAAAVKKQAIDQKAGHEHKAERQNKQEQQQKTAKDKPQQQQSAEATVAAAMPVKTSKKNVREFENGFRVEDLALGPANGKQAKPGKTVVMAYTGRLSNGKVFDKSKNFKFRLGVGEVIKGWDVGVAGMRVGDKRKLSIPPQMAYGPSGVKGTIPPNAKLEFDVELLDVK